MTTPERRDLEEQVTRLTERVSELEASEKAARRDLARWRGIALTRWCEQVGEAADRTDEGAQYEVARLSAELDAMRQTLSWRITRPLRRIRGRQLAGAVR